MASSHHDTGGQLGEGLVDRRGLDRVVAEHGVPPLMPDLVGDGPLADRLDGLESQLVEAELVQPETFQVEAFDRIEHAAHSQRIVGEDAFLDPDHAGPLHTADTGAQGRGHDIELGPRVRAERLVQGDERIDTLDQHLVEGSLGGSDDPHGDSLHLLGHRVDVGGHHQRQVAEADAGETRDG